MLEPICIKEIQEKTQKAQSTIIDKDIQAINNLINKAAGQGNNEIIFQGESNSKIRIKLAEIYKKEGYRVDTMPGAIEIIWRLP